MMSLMLLYCALATPVALRTTGSKPPLDAALLQEGRFQYKTLIKGEESSETDELTVRKDATSRYFEFAARITGQSAQQWEATTTATFRPIAAKLFFGSDPPQLIFRFSYLDGQARGITRSASNSGESRMLSFVTAVPEDVVDQRIDWASVMSQKLVAGARFEYHVFDPKTGVSKISGSVSGPEQVRVPAGVYNAMRIVYRIEKRNGTEMYQVLTNVEGQRMLLREIFPDGVVTDLVSIRKSP